MTVSRLSSLPIHRRDFLRLAAQSTVCAALYPLLGCQPAQPLNIALSPWPGYQFIYLAKDQGLLPAEQITFVETDIVSDSARLLANGEVQAAALTLAEVLELRESGLPVSIVLVFDLSAGADALLVDPAFQGGSSLQGARIGVERSLLGRLMLEKAIDALHIDLASIKVVEMEEEHQQAWDKGQLDAIITYEPALSKLESRGLKRLFDSRSMPQLIFDVLAIRRDLITPHQEALRLLVDGHFKGLSLWQKNRMDTMYRLHARMNLSAEEILLSFKFLDFPDVSYNYKYLSHPSKQLMHATGEIVEVMLKQGYLKSQPDLDQLYLADYLPR